MNSNPESSRVTQASYQNKFNRLAWS